MLHFVCPIIPTLYVYFLVLQSLHFVYMLLGIAIPSYISGHFDIHLFTCFYNYWGLYNYAGLCFDFEIPVSLWNQRF